MSFLATSRNRATVGKSRTAIKSFRSNNKGTTALEFGMVGLPFLMLLFGIIISGLYFFTTMSFENAVEQAGRLIRTGQVDAANMSEADFKTEICKNTPQYVDCDNKVKIFVQSFADNAPNLNPLSCLSPNGESLSSATSYDPGNENSVVLVVACYEWDMTANIPFLDLGNMGSTGKRLIQAATTFRNEPYDDSN